MRIMRTWCLLIFTSALMLVSGCDNGTKTEEPLSLNDSLALQHYKWFYGLGWKRVPQYASDAPSGFIPPLYPLPFLGKQTRNLVILRRSSLEYSYASTCWPGQEKCEKLPLPANFAGWGSATLVGADLWIATEEQGVRLYSLADGAAQFTVHDIPASKDCRSDSSVICDTLWINGALGSYRDSLVVPLRGEKAGKLVSQRVWLLDRKTLQGRQLPALQSDTVESVERRAERFFENEGDLYVASYAASWLVLRKGEGQWQTFPQPILVDPNVPQDSIRRTVAPLAMVAHRGDLYMGYDLDGGVWNLPKGQEPFRWAGHCAKRRGEECSVMDAPRTVYHLMSDGKRLYASGFTSSALSKEGGMPRLLDEQGRWRYIDDQNEILDKEEVSIAMEILQDTLYLLTQRQLLKLSVAKIDSFLQPADLPNKWFYYDTRAKFPKGDFGKPLPWWTP